MTKTRNSACRKQSVGSVALLIEGPKACGKTETASRASRSIVRFDTDPGVRALLDLNPESLFDQPAPILFDEWQRAPEIWDHVRRHVDDLRQRGLYVLTGSATPADDRELHSGAGLLRGEDQRAKPVALEVPELMERIVEVDVPSLGTIRRAPHRLRRTLAALGRNVAQPIKLTDLAADIAGDNDVRPAKETIDAYLDALARVQLTENSPSWRPHMRSRTQLRQAPTRYFVDPSLGTAALGVGSAELLADLNAAGFHFEAMAVRDLRIYAQPLGGTIATWRESHDRKEVDAIVETPTGWAAFEAKLTAAQSVIDSAATGLVEFAAEIDHSRHGAPAALVVVTAAGGGGRRADGVHVVPIATLGP